MAEIAIYVENLSKIYKIYDAPIDRLKESMSLKKKKYHKDHYALSDISFVINKGDTVGIIGTNGSGKSTLLKIITGVLNASMGEVKVSGKVAALLELGAGFNPEYTGIENIYLNGTMMGFTNDEMDKRLGGIIEFADIGDFIHQPIKTYSSGMFARLAFSVAINVDPEILIVDEALSVGDGAFQVKCISRMKQMMRQGTTVLFVTHDMGTIKSFCKECIYLDKGKMKVKGPAQEISDLYLADIRKNMNKANIEVAKAISKEVLITDQIIENKDARFITDTVFEERVRFNREGTGTVKIAAFEMVDEDGNVIMIEKYYQKIKLKVYLQFNENAVVGVGYHIRDDKNVEIIGSSTGLELNQRIEGKKNEQYIVEFASRLPLIEGKYNVSLVVSTPVLENVSALFVDFIDNAYVFEVEQRTPMKLWDKVYIKNEVTIIKA